MKSSSTTVRRMGWLLVSAALAGCAAQPRGDNWLEELRSREVALPEQQMVGSSDGSFAAQVPALRSGSVVEGADADLVYLDIGSETPIECALYHDEVEAASTLQSMANQVFADLEEQYGAAVQREIVKLDAGAAGPSPFLELHWRYQTNQEPGTVFGELKQMISSREGRSVYCVHHENGYAESFRTVFDSLVGSVRFAEYDELRPYYTQIELLSADGQRFGYSVTSLTLDDDGDPRLVRYTAGLGRAADGHVMARDLTEVEHSTTSGQLRDKMITDYRDGEVVRSLLLEERNGDGWRVSGESGGQEIDAEFVYGQLSSWLADASYFRGMLGTAEAVQTVQARTWAPEIETGESVPRVLQLTDQVEEGRYGGVITVGDQRNTVVIDAHGTTVSSHRAFAGREISSERVYVEGALY